MALTYPLVIRDPVHGNMGFTGIEKRIIDQRAFQRLRGLKQSSLANYTYPTALTTRFEHTLGAAHVAGKVITHLLHTCPAGRNSLLRTIRETYPEFNTTGSTDEEQLDLIVQGVRLAALYHDLGHLPFSHCFEEEFKTFLELAVHRAAWGEDYVKQFNELSKLQGKRGAASLKLHEFLSFVIARDHTAIKSTFEGSPWAFSHTIALDILIPPDRFSDPQHPLFTVLGRIIHGELDADRMDFIRRDAGMTGSGLGSFDIDRLVQCLRMDLDDNHLQLWPTVRGLSAVEGFFAARLNIYRWQYHHHNVVFHDLVLRLVIRAVLSGVLSQYPAELLIQELSVQSFLKEEPAPSRSGWLMRDDGYLWAILMNIHQAIRIDQRLSETVDGEPRWLHMLDELLYRRKHHVALWKDRVGFDAFLGALCEAFREYVKTNSLQEGVVTNEQVERSLGEFCTVTDGQVPLEQKVEEVVLPCIAREHAVGQLQDWLWSNGYGGLLVDYRDLTPFRRLRNQPLSRVRMWGRGDSRDGTYEMSKVSDIMAGFLKSDFRRIRLFAYAVVDEVRAENAAATEDLGHPGNGAGHFPGDEEGNYVKARRRDLARLIVRWAFESPTRIDEASCRTLHVRRHDAAGLPAG